MKKIFTVLSLLLAICVCSTGITTTAYATSVDESVLDEAYIGEALSDLSRMNNGRVFEVESASFLKGFSGENEYALLTFKHLGYAIISIQTQRIVEALPDGINPYNQCHYTAYYGGPLNYLYVDNSGSFRSAVDNGLISSDTIQTLSKNADEAVNRQARQKNTEATRAAYPASALVTYSDYIINNMPFGDNVNSTCGSVAAGMMLTYVDNKVLTKGTVVPSEIGYGEDLHQSLIPYCEGSNGSTSASVSAGINDWLNNNKTEYGVSKIITAHYFYAAYNSYAKQSIANGKPVVLALGNVLGSPYGNHQVLAFGYYSNANGNYYNAHIGWRGAGYSNAVIDSSWAIGVCYVE